MRAAASRSSYPWEGEFLDGYADTIESMLYLLAWYDAPEFQRWVDDEIEVMLNKQSDSGFVEQWYLDGNYIRTALLYATYKTQGVTLAPWREDTRLGAVHDANTEALYLHLTVDTRWKGSLQFDLPRHRIFWNLPFDYPRLNGTPAWFQVEPESLYTVTDLDTGQELTFAGQELAKGLEITLDAGAVRRLKVTQE